VKVSIFYVYFFGENILHKNIFGEQQNNPQESTGHEKILLFADSHASAFIEMS
jgi:hypothetical protein